MHYRGFVPHLVTGEAVPLVRQEGGDGVFRGGGDARHHGDVRVASRLEKKMRLSCFVEQPTDSFILPVERSGWSPW